MPSRTWQQGIILKGRPRKGKTPYILIARRTGFMDVWIGDQHFYYNYARSYNNSDDFDVQQAVEEFNESQSSKKQTIVIRRK